MALNRSMVEVKSKWMLKLGYREIWRDRDIADRLTGFKAHKKSTLLSHG